MFELTRHTLYEVKDLVIWNKLKRWGDENDRLLYINQAKYDSEKGKGIYSGETIEFIKTTSPGLAWLPILNQSVSEIPEDELKSLDSFLSLVGRRN